MGMMMVLVATIAWFAIALGWTTEYYALSKGTRDAAEAGSGVLSNLASIQ